MLETPDARVASPAQKATNLASVVAVVDGQAATSNGLGFAADGADALLGVEHGSILVQSNAVLLPEPLIAPAVPVGVLVSPPVIGVGSSPTRHVVTALALIGRVVCSLLGSLAWLAPERKTVRPPLGVSVELGLGSLLLALGARKNVHAGEV